MWTLCALVKASKTFATCDALNKGRTSDEKGNAEFAALSECEWRMAL